MADTPKIEWGSREIKGPTHSYRERLMLKRLLIHTDSGTVLDAGCGTGSLAVELAERGFRVYGIEYSFAGLRHLAQKADRGGLRSVISVAQATAEIIPFRSSSFDAIVCGEVLEHLANDSAAVAGFRRMLKPGGICVVTVPANPDLWTFCDEYAGHFRRYTKDGLTKLFESNGFRVLRLDSWGFPLGRLYQRFVFRPYMRRQQERKSAQGTVPGQRNRSMDVLASLVAALFRLDNLFLWGNWGVGFLLTAQREV
jgi:SAM-dependent methyltransferase